MFKPQTSHVYFVLPGFQMGSGQAVRPVSITRFPLTRFSPGSGLLRSPFVHRSLRFFRVWVRKNGNLVMETRCAPCSKCPKCHKCPTVAPNACYIS